jgi:hypothetical protein
LTRIWCGSQGGAQNLVSRLGIKARVSHDLSLVYTHLFKVAAIAYLQRQHQQFCPALIPFYEICGISPSITSKILPSSHYQSTVADILAQPIKKSTVLPQQSTAVRDCLKIWLSIGLAPKIALSAVTPFGMSHLSLLVSMRTLSELRSATNCWI